MNRSNILCLFLLLGTAGAFAQNAISPGSIDTTASFQHIGVRWTISGDDNNDG